MHRQMPVLEAVEPGPLQVFAVQVPQLGGGHNTAQCTKEKTRGRGKNGVCGVEGEEGEDTGVEAIQDDVEYEADWHGSVGSRIILQQDARMLAWVTIRQPMFAHRESRCRDRHMPAAAAAAAALSSCEVEASRPPTPTGTFPQVMALGLHSRLLALAATTVIGQQRGLVLRRRGSGCPVSRERGSVASFFLRRTREVVVQMSYRLGDHNDRQPPPATTVMRPSSARSVRHGGGGSGSALQTRGSVGERWSGGHR